MLSRGLIAWAAALAVVPASAQEIARGPADPATRELSTDRPDKTESPFTVPAGRVQVEADLVGYTREREAGVEATLLNVATTNLKFGIARNADLQVIAAPYLRATVTDRVTGARDRVEGVGDVTVRLKHNLWGNDGGTTALALMPFVTLPTAKDGLGAGKAEFGLIVPFALALSERVGLGAMTEIDAVGDSDGDGYQASFINSATVSAELTERLGGYVELFTERGTARGERWIVTGDLGVTYALTEETQLDAGANIGLTRAADDLNVFVGVSRRF